MATRRLVLAALGALLLNGCRLSERLRDWNWDLRDITSHAGDIVIYHIARLGWHGYLIVPAAVILGLLAFRPTRYVVSLVLIDIYRHTLSHVFKTGFELLVWSGKWILGQVIARFRGAVAWFSNFLRQ
jgi:hypothetical protein